MVSLAHSFRGFSTVCGSVDSLGCGDETIMEAEGMPEAAYLMEDRK